jgi:hypothetical protein
LPGLLVVVGDIKEWAVAGMGWWTNQFHPGLLRGSTRLATVAGDTGTNYILPGMLATSVAGDDVVYGKLPGFLTAILAGKPVTVEDL